MVVTAESIDGYPVITITQRSLSIPLIFFSNSVPGTGKDSTGSSNKGSKPQEGKNGSAKRQSGLLLRKAGTEKMFERLKLLYAEHHTAKEIIYITT